MPITLAQARDFLAALGPVANVAVLGAGDWSQAFSFNRDGHELVARFGLHRADFEADRRAMAYDHPDLPVPAVLDIGPAFDGAYAISERRHGVFLESLDGPAVRALVPAVLSAFDVLRLLPTPPLSGAGSQTPWRDWLVDSLVDRPGERVSGWRPVLAEDRDADSVFTAGLLALERLAPRSPEVRHVIHGDLLNRNVLVAGDGLRAVIDWGSMKFGDFVYELAWFVFWAPWHPGLATVDWRAEALAHLDDQGLVVPDVDLRLRVCQLSIGLEHLAYCAFTRSVVELPRIAARTAALIEG